MLPSVQIGMGLEAPSSVMASLEAAELLPAVLSVELLVLELAVLLLEVLVLHAEAETAIAAATKIVSACLIFM